MFYQRVIESFDPGEDSYVILMTSDSYDIPFKGSDDQKWDEGSTEVFDYIICGICPVKDAKASLRYYSEEKSFRGASSGHVLGAPDIGFMFPAFDDRSPTSTTHFTTAGRYLKYTMNSSTVFSMWKSRLCRRTLRSICSATSWRKSRRGLQPRCGEDRPRANKGESAAPQGEQRS